MNDTWQRIFQFPLVKIITGSLVCIGAMLIGQKFLQSTIGRTNLNKDVLSVISAIILPVVTISAYCFLFRAYEQRKITELSFKNMWENTGGGILTGIVLQSLAILVIVVSGGYKIVYFNNPLYLIPLFLSAFGGAIVEEILFRGIIFRITEESLGSVLALIISAALFGCTHLANKNSSWFMALSIAVQAGLLLGAAYMATRSLWFPIAIHSGWNFAESGVYGAAVSGNEAGRSLITSSITGNKWITGGIYGPEGSLQATVFCLCAFVALFFLSKKRGRVLKPFWVKA